MRGTTEGHWWVPEHLTGEEHELNGVIVVTGPETNMHLVADCRSTTLPLSEQRANAKLAARAPALAEALLRIEDKVGDMKHNENIDAIYSLIAAAMRDLNVRRREEDDD